MAKKHNAVWRMRPGPNSGVSASYEDDRGRKNTDVICLTRGDEETASQIVREHNAHAALVKACQEALIELNETTERSVAQGLIAEALTLADALE